MLAAIKEGADWKECVKLLKDVDLPFVKTHYFDRWAKKYGPKGGKKEADRPVT